MSKFLLSLTSTEPAAGCGSVKTIMPSPSGDDAGHDWESAKEAEGEQETESNQTTDLTIELKAGDGQEGRRDPQLEDIFEGAIEEEEELEDLIDSKADASGGEGEEQESQENVEEGEEEEDEDEEQQPEQPEEQVGPKYEIEVDELQPDEDIAEEEEVEEYEYTKDEIKYMKTAFVAYQQEKPQSKQGPKKPDKKKEVKTTEIPISTLGSVLRSLGLNPTERALQRYAEWLGAESKKGIVKFEELLIIVGREKKVIIDESHVLEAFRFIDVENEGVIPIQTLRDLLVNTCERFTPEEWIIFVHLADPKKTGFVHYVNFVERMGPNPPIPEKKKIGKKGKKGKKK